MLNTLVDTLRCIFANLSIEKLLNLVFIRVINNESNLRGRDKLSYVKVNHLYVHNVFKETI